LSKLLGKKRPKLANYPKKFLWKWFPDEWGRKILDLIVSQSGSRRQVYRGQQFQAERKKFKCDGQLFLQTDGEIH
jgi:hypothetical protein